MLERTSDQDHSREIFFDIQIKPIVQNPLVAEAFRRVDRRSFTPKSLKTDAA